MDAALISALAAVGGSMVGSMGPVMANHIVQKGQTRRELLTHEIALRESLYTEFIKDAARMYAKSLTSNLDTLDEIVALYALVSRLRLVASDNVLHAAETLVSTIGKQYGEPNLTMIQIDAEVQGRKVDPLGPFSAACRKELRDVARWNSRLLTWRRSEF